MTDQFDWLSCLTQKKTLSMTGFLLPLFSSGLRNHVDILTLVRSLFPEFHYASGRGVQGMILTTSDIGTRMKLRASLTDDDIACCDLLAAVNLNSQPFGF
jgi:hypothetical protein